MQNCLHLIHFLPPSLSLSLTLTPTYTYTVALSEHGGDEDYWQFAQQNLPTGKSIIDMLKKGLFNTTNLFQSFFFLILTALRKWMQYI